MPITTKGDLHVNPNSPDYWHPFFREIEPTLEYLKDMYLGRRRWIDDGGKITDSEKAYYYLPQAEAQEDDQYVRQLRASVFRRFFREAVEKDFSSILCDFQLTEDAGDFEDYQDNVDLMGNSLQVFLKKFLAMALRDGSAFCLVDMPKADEKAETLADVSRDIRPYFVLYERDQVVNWRWLNTEWGPVLAMVVLKEEITRADGDFGHKTFERYRVIRIDGTYEVYEIETGYYDRLINPQSNDQAPRLELVETGSFNALGVPLVGLSLTSHDAFTADFPLIEMADLTLDYYRVRSGYRATLDYMEPTLFAQEEQSYAADEDSSYKSVKVGANAVIWNLKNVEWVEPQGGGIAPKERCLASLEEQIQKMTVSFFTGGAIAKTATEVELDAAQSESTLQGYAYHLESAVQEMFKHFAYYQGRDPEEAGGIVVNKSILKPAAEWTPKEILEWITTGAMSREMGYKILFDLDLLPEGLSLEEFEEEVDGEELAEDRGEMPEEPETEEDTKDPEDMEEEDGEESGTDV